MGAKKKATASSRVQRFNSQNKIGTRVAYMGAGAPFVTKTRTMASVASSGDPVVFIEGISGYVHLSHVEVIQ